MSGSGRIVNHGVTGVSVQWKAGYINVVGSNSNFWNSGDVTGCIGNGTISKSEFSQEKN